MNKQPRFTYRAKADIQAAWDYIAEHNLAATDRLVDAIREKARFHANFPKTGRARDEIRAGLRSSPVPPYVILFHAIDDTIEVLRVLHNARAIDSIMAEDE